MRTSLRPLTLAAALVLSAAPVAYAQRELHWDRLAVAARLNADGSLEVVEEQTMVFTGDWNGGERTFNIRPRQTLSFEGMSRGRLPRRSPESEGGSGSDWQPMTENAGLGNVDDYFFTDANSLRWRSRMPGDPPFNQTSLRYQLRYTLSGILKQDGDRYTLDHDFAFPDRKGVIKQVEVRLTLDPAWQPIEPVRDVYTAANLAPGKNFVVTIPLTFVGAGAPHVFDDSRPPAIQMAVLSLFGLTALSILWTLASEQSKGRFAPVETSGIDDAWLRAHILKFPAELVSAAWDDSIGQGEVVALLSRMTTEGKLESQIADAGKPGMTLRLKVDRSTLTGYERALIDKLFFDNRTTTSTDEVKAHYQKTGFDPTGVIREELTKTLQDTFPFAKAPRVYGIATFFFFILGLALVITAWARDEIPGIAVFFLPLGALAIAGLASISGLLFRRHMEWGWRAAVLSLIAPCVVVTGVAAFLWYVVGTGRLDVSSTTLWAILAFALGAGNLAVNAMRTRQQREGIAFRKRLTAGRLFFMSELDKPSPALRDDWYPWVLAFELGKQMDDWSVRHATDDRHNTSFGTTSSGSSSGPGSSSTSWTGFGGGRSGGGGATGSWAAAAGGFAAGVAAPSSSSSGGGGGGGGGGGSSGGGGGGGW